MAVKTFNTRIKLKNDSAAAWSNANFALLAGEFGWDSTNNNFKIGSGNWNALDYAIPVADGSTITSSTTDHFKTFSVGSIGTNKVTALTDYSLGSTTYSPLATTDSLNDALAKLEAGVNAAAAGGVQSIGGATGTVTLGNGLTSATGANGSVSTLVNGYIVNTAGANSKALDIDSTKIDSNYTAANNTNLATVATVTAAINGLDVNDITGFGAGKTLATLTETDGKIAATFQDISIASSQINDLANTYSSDGTAAITGTGVAAALGTLNGTHNVATLETHTPGTGEIATQKISFFDGTQTNGELDTADTASETLYFKSAVTAANPIVTNSDLSGIVGAMVYQGTVDGTHALPASPEKGWVYMVAANGTYDGKACETGDMIVYNGTGWDVINGENQVTNAGATIVAGASDGTNIATVDGTTITAKVSVTGGSATIASQSGNAVTIKTGVTQTGTTGTIDNDSGTDITLADVAVTGAAADVSITDSADNFTATNVEAALTELAGKITSANITIDGHKGAITTGNGLTDVDTDGGSFAVLIDQSNANGLSVGANGVSMALATGSSFGTVEVTSGNGLTLTDGVVAYAHNTTAVNIASKNSTTNVITVQGTLTPDASDAITTSNAVTFAPVAATGAANELTVTSATYGGSTATTNAQEALNNLATAIAEGTNGKLSTSASAQAKTPSGESMSDNIVLHDIAKTGNTDDLIQGMTILFDCGSATTVTDAPAN